MMREIEMIEKYIKDDDGCGDYKWHNNNGELIRCRNCKSFNTELDERGFCARGNLRNLRKDKDHANAFCSEAEKEDL